MGNLKLIAETLLNSEGLVVEQKGDVVEVHSENLEGTLQPTNQLSSMSTDSNIGFVANINYSNDVCYQRDMIPNGEAVKEKYTVAKDGKRIEASAWIDILPYGPGERCQEDTVFANSGSLYRFGVDTATVFYRMDMYDGDSPYIYRQHCRKGQDFFFENVQMKFKNSNGDYYYNQNVDRSFYNSDNNMFYSMNYLPNGDGKLFCSYGYLNVQEDQEKFLYNVPGNIRAFSMHPENLIPELDINQVQSYFAVNYDGHKFIINKTRSKYVIYYLNYYSTEEIVEMLKKYTVVDAERFEDEFTYKERKVEEVPYAHKHKFDSESLRLIADMIPTMITDEVMANITTSELNKFIDCLEAREKGIFIHDDNRVVDIMSMPHEERLSKLADDNIFDNITSKIEASEDEIKNNMGSNGGYFVKKLPSYK